MEGRCESNCRGDEVYPATFGNEEKTGLKLDRLSKSCNKKLPLKTKKVAKSNVGKQLHTCCNKVFCYLRSFPKLQKKLQKLQKLALIISNIKLNLWNLGWLLASKTVWFLRSLPVLLIYFSYIMGK